MHNDGIKKWALFYFKNFRNCNWIKCVCAKSINGLSWKCNKASILNNLAEAETLYFILYDITEDPAVLLSVKELNVVPNK